MPYDKPIPEPDELSQPFFDGARQHKLMIQRCRSCGNYLPPARARCYICLSTELEWVQASGRGTLHSFGLMHQKYHPAFESEIPYNVAVVALEEGVKLPTSIIGCGNDQLRCDMTVEVVFEDINEEVSLPKFRPAG